MISTSLAGGEFAVIKDARGRAEKLIPIEQLLGELPPPPGTDARAEPRLFKLLTEVGTLFPRDGVLVARIATLGRKYGYHDQTRDLLARALPFALDPSHRATLEALRLKD